MGFRFIVKVCAEISGFRIEILGVRFEYLQFDLPCWRRVAPHPFSVHVSLFRRLQSAGSNVQGIAFRIKVLGFKGQGLGLVFMVQS